MDRPLDIRLLGARAAIHPIRARMPFRYGNACLTVSPVLTVELEAASPDGRRARGHASDCLPPRWFDKDPGKGYRENVRDQLRAHAIAREVYLGGGEEPRSAFDHWNASFPDITRRAEREGLNALTASFGSSFFERAMIDAVCRLAGVSFFDAIGKGLVGLDTPRGLPDRPLESIACRHTVGLADPITTAEIPAGERLDDGLPQSLEECIERYGLDHFKLKVQGDEERDLERLSRIARLLASRCPKGYLVSLDGNEQYRDASGLESLLARLEERPHGSRLVESIAYIEQPLARDVALEDDVAAAVRRLSKLRPVIIDESDDLPESFRRAVDLGYDGTSHKNCKGIFKSLRNLALASELNSELGEERYFLTAEDLANTAVIPLQQDLCSLAALGIHHAERNGHHYFRGLDHLPPTEARQAVESHPDLYRETGGSVFLRIEGGRIRCGSLQRVGYGHDGTVELDRRTPLEEWSFDELEEG